MLLLLMFFYPSQRHTGSVWKPASSASHSESDTLLSINREYLPLSLTHISIYSPLPAIMANIQSADNAQAARLIKVQWAYKIKLPRVKDCPAHMNTCPHSLPADKITTERMTRRHLSRETKPHANFGIHAIWICVNYIGYPKSCIFNLSWLLNLANMRGALQQPSLTCIMMLTFLCSFHNTGRT